MHIFQHGILSLGVSLTRLGTRTACFRRTNRPRSGTCKCINTRTWRSSSNLDLVFQIFCWKGLGTIINQLEWASSVERLRLALSLQDGLLLAFMTGEGQERILPIVSTERQARVYGVVVLEVLLLLLNISFCCVSNVLLFFVLFHQKKISGCAHQFHTLTSEWAICSGLFYFESATSFDIYH